MTSRAIDEYLAVLDEAAFGAATPVTPKRLSPSDPASRWTGADGGLAYFAYCTNYLIGVDHAMIVDVEPSTACARPRWRLPRRCPRHRQDRRLPDL